MPPSTYFDFSTALLPPARAVLRIIMQNLNPLDKVLAEL